jgi:hypothetical protein
MRLVIHHSVGASETLFIAFASLAITLYRTDEFAPMLLAVWAGCVTRIEGMVIGALIGVCYLTRLDIVRALAMFLTFLAPASMALLHKWRFDDWLAYIHFNQNSQHLIEWPPFREVTGIAWSSDELRSHSFVSNYLLFAFASALTFTRSIPIGLFAIAFAAYVSLLNHSDIYRYSLPGAVFAFVVGLDAFWASPCGKVTCCVAAPFYLVLLVLYTYPQIHSNIAWPDFMDDVMSQI